MSSTGTNTGSGNATPAPNARPGTNTGNEPCMKMHCSGLSEPDWRMLQRRDQERQDLVVAAEAATAAAQAATATAEAATTAARAAEAAALARALHAEKTFANAVGRWLRCKDEHDRLLAAAMPAAAAAGAVAAAEATPVQTPGRALLRALSVGYADHRATGQHSGSSGH